MKKNLILILLAFSCCTGTVFSQDAKELVEKGQRKAMSGKYTEAIVDYNQAIETDSEYLDAYLKRAFALGMLKEYQKAVDDYTVVLGKHKDHLYSYISRGSAYNKLGQPEKALSDFNKAIALDPKNEEAYNNRGWAKKAIGDHEGACDDWKTSKKLGNAEAKIILKNNDC